MAVFSVFTAATLSPAPSGGKINLCGPESCLRILLFATNVQPLPGQATVLGKVRRTLASRIDIASFGAKLLPSSILLTE